jgi:uncharacterized SAM-binding protein YcdF (DUF218 family)
MIDSELESLGVDAVTLVSDRLHLARCKAIARALGLEVHVSGRAFSDDTLRRELHRLRYTWKRSRYTLDPDPEFGGKKEAHPVEDPAIAGA